MALLARLLRKKLASPRLTPVPPPLRPQALLPPTPTIPPPPPPPGMSGYQGARVSGTMGWSVGWSPVPLRRAPPLRPQVGWSPVPLRRAPPLRPQALTEMGVRPSARRSFSSGSSQEEKNWRSHLKSKVEEINAVKNSIKDHMPTFSAAKKEIQTRIKGLLVDLIDLLLDFAHMITDHVVEGFKAKVNETVYLIFLLAVVWGAYLAGVKLGIFGTSLYDPDFEEMMKNLPKDANGEPVKVALALMGLNLLHLLLKEAKSIGFDIWKIKSEGDIIRSEVKMISTRTEKNEAIISALQWEIKKLKEMHKSGAGEVQNEQQAGKVQQEHRRSGAGEGQQQPRG